MNIINERKLGKFSASREVLIDYTQMKLGAVFRDLVVLETHMSFVDDHITYTAAHPDFRPLADGEVIPTYRCLGHHVCVPEGGCFIKWEEVK